MSSNLDSQSVQIQQSELPERNTWAETRQNSMHSRVIHRRSGLPKGCREAVERLGWAGLLEAPGSSQAGGPPDLLTNKPCQFNCSQTQSVQIQQSGLPERPCPAIWTPRASRSSNLSSQSVQIQQSGLPERPDQFWGLLEASGCSWSLPESPRGFWRLLEAPWRLLEASGGFWRLLEASGGSWRDYWRLTT